MGLAIDATGIQFKLLNRSRGPAVWSPRAQADKRRYGAWVRDALAAEPNITWMLQAGRPDPDRGRPRRRPRVRGRRAGRVPRARHHDGHVSERPRPYRRRAAAVGPGGRTADAATGGFAAVGRVRDGPTEDGHAPAARSPQHRLLALPRRARRSTRSSRFRSARRQSRANRWTCHLVLHERARPGPGARQHRPIAPLQRADRRDRSALLPVARGQGDALPGQGAAPDLSRAGRAGRRTRSTSTACR